MQNADMRPYKSLQVDRRRSQLGPIAVQYTASLIWHYYQAKGGPLPQ